MIYLHPYVGNIIIPSESLLLELSLYAALAVIVAWLFISSTMSGVKKNLANINMLGG
jgi:hypothetical protein